MEPPALAPSSSAAPRINSPGQSDIVCLNVGGQLFATSAQTLKRDPDSMLGRMFCSHMGLTTDANGNIFIDRDGTHFRHILNYLRSGSVPQLPPSVRKELLQEADFYQLRGLAQALHSGTPGGPDISSDDGGLFNPANLCAATVDAVKRIYSDKYEEIKRELKAKIAKMLEKGGGHVYYHTSASSTYEVSATEKVLSALMYELKQAGFRHLRTTCKSSKRTPPLAVPQRNYVLELEWMPAIDDLDESTQPYADANRVEVVNWRRIVDEVETVLP